jgi:high affinity sulfate transporter 1
VFQLESLARIAPGLAALGRYRRGDLPHDLAAGLAVAAVTVPTTVANAQLAGFPPAIGLYASILPLLVYALFGTSRQLMVGTNAVGGAMIAAAVAPLAAGDPTLTLDLAMALTLVTGILCIGASFLRLGALADFLSKPILVGFMNGVAISIVLSQVSNLFGISIEANGIVPRAWEFVSKLALTHWPTLLVGLGTIVVLAISPRIVKHVPGILIALALAAIVVQVLGLEQTGVVTIGPVPRGLPTLRIPLVPLDKLPLLVAEAAGLALVAFSTTMLAARSFADRNRYDIDADREMVALGAANIGAAVSQGFVVSGIISRTSIGEAAGGRTQITGIVAATVIALVLVAFTEPLQYIPAVSLAAVLVTVGAALFDWRTLAEIRQIDRHEFWIAMIATIGVIAVGVMNAILVAVVLALLIFVRFVSRPKVEVLGEIPGQPGFHSTERHPEATTQPGLVLFRFNGPMIFFSAPYFKREALKAAAAAGPELKWFIIDLLPVNMIDATGFFTLQEVFDELRSRGVVAGAAAREAEWADWAATRSLSDKLARNRFFTTLRQAVNTYKTDVVGAASEPLIERDAAG